MKPAEYAKHLEQSGEGKRVGYGHLSVSSHVELPLVAIDIPPDLHNVPKNMTAKVVYDPVSAVIELAVDIVHHAAKKDPRLLPVLDSMLDALEKIFDQAAQCRANQS